MNLYPLLQVVHPVAAVQEAQLAIQATQLVPDLKNPPLQLQLVKSPEGTELAPQNLQVVELKQSKHPVILHTLTQLVPLVLAIKSPEQVKHLLELQVKQLACHSVQATQVLFECK